MKILIVAEFFYPRTGGGEIVLFNIAKTLAKKNNYEINVVTSRIKNTRRSQLVEGIKIHRPFQSYDCLSNYNAYTIKSVGKRILFNIKLIFWLKKYIKSEKPDLIHILDIPPAIVTSWMAHLNNIPCTFNIGGFNGRSWFHLTKPLMAFFNYFSEIITLKYGLFDGLRCGSTIVAEKSKQYVKNEISVIPSPIDPNEIKEIKHNTKIDKTREKLAVGKKDKFLLFAGSLSPVKNIEGLIESIKKINIDYKLIIIGDGPQKFCISKLIKKYKLGKKVFLAGKKSHYETLKAIYSCDILLLPSKMEVFPTVILEALGLGKPVVATNVGGVSDIKSLNLNLVSNLNDINGSLLNNISCKSNEEEILNKYSIKTISKLFEKFFEKIIEENK